MDREEAHALRQVVKDQAERLDSVREQVVKARRALLDHDLELVRYWLNQIEEMCNCLVPTRTSPETMAQRYLGVPKR